MPTDANWGIPRSEMPQIAYDDYPEFFDYMKTYGVKFKAGEKSPKSLKPIQADYSEKGIEKSIEGGRYNNKPILISSDYYILDGHHRWLAALNDDGVSRVFQANIPMKSLYKLTLEFPKIFFKDIYEKEKQVEENKREGVWEYYLTEAELRRDEHERLIAWENEEYMISINSETNMNYVAAWKKDPHRDKRIGTMYLQKGRYYQTKDYLSVGSVDVAKKYRDQGIGLKMYKVAAEYCPERFKGLASEGPDRANNREVPRIWKRLGAYEDEAGNWILDIHNENALKEYKQTQVWNDDMEANIILYENPSSRDLVTKFADGKSWRGIVDMRQGKDIVYLWNAREAIHYQIAESLNIDVDDFYDHVGKFYIREYDAHTWSVYVYDRDDADLIKGSKLFQRMIKGLNVEYDSAMSSLGEGEEELDEYQTWHEPGLMMATVKPMVMESGYGFLSGRQQVNELFDKPYKWKTDWKSTYNYQASFQTENKSQVEVYAPYDIEQEIINFSFERDGTESLTGTGNAMRIFTTVMDIMRKAVKHYVQDKKFDLKGIAFAAKSSEQSRVSLYKRFAKMAADELGWTVHHLNKDDVYDTFVIQEGVGRITKQNQTDDVGPNQIPIETAKYGFKTDKDGRPPLYTSKKTRKNTTPNTAYNLGLTEAKVIHAHSDNAFTPVDQKVWVNPNAREFDQLVRQIKSVRGFFNRMDGNVYVWDGNGSVHTGMANALGISGETIDFVADVYDVPEDSLRMKSYWNGEELLKQPVFNRMINGIKVYLYTHNSKQVKVVNEGKLTTLPFQRDHDVIDVQVIEGPIFPDIARLAKMSDHPTREMRGFVDIDTGKLYIWNGYYATHSEMYDIIPEVNDYTIDFYFQPGGVVEFRGYNNVSKLLDFPSFKRFVKGGNWHMRYNRLSEIHEIGENEQLDEYKTERVKTGAHEFMTLVNPNWRWTQGIRDTWRGLYDRESKKLWMWDGMTGSIHAPTANALGLTFGRCIPFYVSPRTDGRSGLQIQYYSRDDIDAFKHEPALRRLIGELPMRFVSASQADDEMWASQGQFNNPGFSESLDEAELSLRIEKAWINVKTGEVKMLPKGVHHTDDVWPRPSKYGLSDNAFKEYLAAMKELGGKYEFSSPYDNKVAWTMYENGWVRYLGDRVSGGDVKGKEISGSFSGETLENIAKAVSIMRKNNRQFAEIFFTDEAGTGDSHRLTGSELRAFSHTGKIPKSKTSAFRENSYMKEGFDTPYDYEWVEEMPEFGVVEFRTDNGVRYSIDFNLFDEKSNLWAVEFSNITDDNYDVKHKLSGTGDQWRVFATVMAALRDFIGKYKPMMVSFTASNTEPNREKLYDRMIKKYAGQFKGYRLVKKDEDYDDPQWTFERSR